MICISQNINIYTIFIIMKIIITESQKKILLIEGSSDNWGEIINYYIDRFKNTILPGAISYIKEVGQQIKGSINFLSSWGAGISGFIGPIEDYIRGEFPTLSDQDVYLLLVAIVSLIFFKEKDATEQIKKIVKERKIESDGKKISLGKILSSVLPKAEKLCDTTKKFLVSLGYVVSRMTAILAFSFLSPIIPGIITFLSSGSIEFGDIDEIVTRLLSFVTLTMTYTAMDKFMKRLYKRVASKKDEENKDS